MEQMDDKTFPRMRRSACAESSLRAEIERLKRMTALERANAALDLGKIFGGDEQTVLKPKEEHGR
jgi:hypothetical protein